MAEVSGVGILERYVEKTREVGCEKVYVWCVWGLVEIGEK